MNEPAASKLSCYAYLRVSGLSQVEGDGLDRQLRAIRSHADSHNPRLRIAKIFREEGVPGKTEWTDRPAWRQMVAELRPEVRVIVIEKLDRLARELFIQEYILRDLKKRGVTLLSVHEPDLDSDPSRVLFRQIMGAIAQYDKDMLVMRMRAGINAIKARGLRCEGRKPFGQHPDHPGEAGTLSAMLKLSAEGLTPTAIARALNSSSHHKSRTGRPWTTVPVSRILKRLDGTLARVPAPCVSDGTPQTRVDSSIPPAPPETRNQAPATLPHS